ncbi:MAG: exo-beta-N-acetylmuramidase NamZ domain-containing protein [Bacilli bacterium]|nr:DUF1343 domain-containing protein [Bacilli bacterium]
MRRSLKLFTFLLLIFFLIGCNETIVVEEYVISSVDVVKVGEKLNLKTNIENPAWYSSNESFAQVDSNGVVTAIKIGTATIFASNNEKTASLDITIIKSDKIDDPASNDVLLGIDRIDDYLELFAGKRVGLITNQTGINSNYESTIDVLFEKVNLVALFAPEHGIRGDLQAGATAPTYIDEKTGLTVYSLYGATLKPTKAMMDKIDILCIDIQDAGARFYTYVYTMSYAMEACAEFDKEFVVFDRPNPAGAHLYEGNILELEYASFVGRYPIVQRHGMTIGELAQLFNEEYEINCDLEVILMDNYDRTMFFDDTNLPWVIPSPNFPSINTAIVYTGTCIFEGTNLSEGRGTTIPFEVIGAPYIDAYELAEALNALNLDGVIFRPAYFTPTFSKNANKLNAGVQVHVTDRETFKSVKTGWAMLEVIRDLYPNDFQLLSSMNRLTGTDYISKRTYTLEEQFAILEEDTNTFGLIREKYLLY